MQLQIEVCRECDAPGRRWDDCRSRVPGRVSRPWAWEFIAAAAAAPRFAAGGATRALIATILCFVALPSGGRASDELVKAESLHWVTLPKGSPDDNPVENIFSDLQLMVLNNSNDPDVKTTQQRISRYLQKLNRRRQRRIHIPYLFDSHRN
jgi:hypothetical protein